jgi:hypothetical protein
MVAGNIVSVRFVRAHVEVGHMAIAVAQGQGQTKTRQ